MNRAAALVSLFVFAFASACATRVPPTRVPLLGDDPRPARYVAELKFRNDQHQSLSAALRVSLDAPDLRLRRPQRLALVRPTHLRVEVLGLFGQVAAVLVSDGATYQFFDARNGAVQSGPVSRHIFWDLARVDLTPQEVVELLMGAPIPNPSWQRAGTFALPEDAVSVDYVDASGVLRQQFDFDAEGLPRAVRSYDEMGRQVWSAGYDDYRDVDGSVFPFLVTLESERVEASARFAFQTVSLDPELPDALFQLGVPIPVNPD